MEKNFEQSMQELEQIVKVLEKGELTLDESIQKFKQGVELANICNSKLEQAEKSITLLTSNKTDEIIEEEFSV